MMKKSFLFFPLGKRQDFFNKRWNERSIKQMKPNKFDDIIALVALYRPGPMSNIPIYNDCKNGIKQPDYIHPTLKEI